MTPRERQLWMRKEADTILELTKGLLPEQRINNNLLSSMEQMANFVMELTSDATLPTAEERMQASLDALNKYFEETPQEEIDKTIAEIDAMGIEGPSVEEYFASLNPNHLYNAGVFDFRNRLRIKLRELHSPSNMEDVVNTIKVKVGEKFKFNKLVEEAYQELYKAEGE